MTPQETLHEAIEGAQGFDGLGPEDRALVRLAWECRRSEVSGPGVAALDRMTARFDQFLESGEQSQWRAWAAAWFGQGGMPRPLAQRLAAAGLILGAAGFGGAAATGTSPEQVISGVASFATSAIENLAPRSGGDDGSSPAGTTVTATASPTGTPPATRTPSPRATGEAGIAGTPGVPGTPAGADDGPSTATPPPPGPTATPASSAGTLIPPTTAEPSVTESPEPGASTPPPGATQTPPTTTTPTPTQSPTTPTSGGGFSTQSYSAGPAGTVVLRYSATSIEVLSVSAAPGWKYDISDVDSLSLKVEFEGGDQHVVFRASLENGVPVTSLAEDEGEGESSD